MQNIVFGSRTFQLWEFHASHGFLLIRSPKSDKAETNIDIICIDVEYLAVPRFLKEITITEATSEEIKNLGKILGNPMDNYEFSRLSEYTQEKVIDYKHILGKSIRPPYSSLILESRGKRFPIILLHYWIEEHQKDNLYSPFKKYIYGTE